MELEEKVVEPCIKAVKEEIPHGDFDAYVEDGTVKTVGSQRSLSSLRSAWPREGTP